MKQKYLLSKDAENGLTIKEYAELEAGIFSLLCEESFTGETIMAGMDGGRDILVSVLRTHNMYPPVGFAEAIADAVEALFNGGEERKELLFDDMDFIYKEQDVETSFDSDEEDADLDDLLEDDIEEDAYNEDGFEVLEDKDKGSIAIAEDDDSVDI